jgi:hypothetical protein
VGPVLADAEQVFRGWIQCRDKKVLVEKNDGRVQRRKDIAVRWGGAYFLIVFC